MVQPAFALTVYARNSLITDLPVPETPDEHAKPTLLAVDLQRVVPAAAAPA
jgi:hypothetical protein